MRRLTAWIGGALGGVTAYRLLRRRPQAVPEQEPAADGRAEELRAKLAESRVEQEVVAEREPEPEAEVVAEPEPEAPEPESPEERRRRVHEEGRAALDEMKPEEKPG